ncbi:MAG: carbohydrate binding domain-containing protein [Candidatus Zixiibacteriota bacterium]|nr:MAG: carbohydrate binding domain-containing protein [candidate division Zixibacteria bacterium]
MRPVSKTTAGSLLLCAAVLLFGLSCSGNDPMSPDHASPAIRSPAKPLNPGRAQNLILNGGFEENWTHWEAIWGIPYLSISEDNPHDGLKCLRYEVPVGTVDFGILRTFCYDIYLQEGTTYEFSFWTRQDNPDGEDPAALVSVWAYTDFGDFPFSIYEITPDWRKARFRFEAASTYTIDYLEIWFQTFPERPSCIVVDDFAIFRVR